MDRLDFRPGAFRAWASLEEGAYAVHVTGWADVGGDILAGPSLAKALLGRLHGDGGLAAALPGLAGSYAVAAETPHAIHLAVDPVRSIPVVHREDGDAVSASDEAARLGAGLLEVDRGAALEFLAAGYVLGPKTLRRGLHALQPGECLTLRRGERLWRRDEHAAYDGEPDSDATEEALLSGLDAALRTAMDRTVRSLAGRQAVVPLSGGLDSRLVAASLREAGCADVLCFSYGRRGNWESARSRQVAEALGYRWVQVPYTGAAWRAALGDPRMHAYWRFACNEVSLPHVAEWIALASLREQGAVRRDAVFLPGHTGDFLSGGHLKYVLDPAWNPSPGSLSAAIVAKHLSLWEDVARYPPLREALETEVHSAEVGPGASERGLATGYERWEWRERQPKLVVNGVRLYEFHGYGWRIPLWDPALMAFWRAVPLDQKRGKRLYRKYLLTKDPAGVFGGEAELEPADEARAATAPPTRGPRWRARRMRKHFADYRSHPLAYGQAFGFVRYVLRDAAKRHSDGLLADEVLARIHGIDAARLRREASRPRGRAPG